jgi:autotransporter-associated beta strand protein
MGRPSGAGGWRSCALRAGSLALLVLLSTSTLCRAQVNFLPNGSFERRTVGGIPDRWTSAYSGIPSVVSNVATRCGEFVLRLVDTSSSQAAGLYSEALPVTPGLSYTAEAYVMRTDATSNSPLLYLKYYDAAGAETGSFSAASAGAVNAWDYVSVTGSAPASAATVKVLCYSTIAATGTMYFDGVSLRLTPAAPPAGQLVRYVAPTAVGTGSGVDPANPAKYNDAAFWTGIKAGLNANPVQVIFLEGEYVINTAADSLVLSSIGNAGNQLTLEGQHPFGSVFTRTDAAQIADAPAMVHLQYATNVVVRHLHWENDTTLSGRLVQYCLAINGSNTGAETKNISVEACSFVGLSWNIYGAMGFHYAQTHGGRVSNCEFITGGYSSGFHMIYNAYGAYDLCFENNYFQDCAGAYLRLRAGCHEAVVRSNEFVSTSSFYNQPFIQMPTFNNIDPGDETWGHNFKFLNNRFNYLVAGSGQNVAIHFYHSGFDPARAPGLLWDYLLTPAEAAVLTSGTVAARKELVRTNFGVNLDTQVAIAGNTRLGFHAYDMKLESKSVSSYSYQEANGVWHICPNYGGDGAWDISDLAGQPAVPTTNSWLLNLSSNWDNAANWTPAGVPNGIGAVALLTNNLATSARTNTIDSNVTLGKLCLGSLNGATNFVLEASRGSTLTLNNGGLGAELIATTGNASDSINAPIELADDLMVTNTKNLALRGVISELGPFGGYGAPRTITKTGIGTLTLYGANTSSGGWAIKEGTVNGPGKMGFGPIALGDTAGAGSATLLGSGTYTNAIVVVAGSTGSKTLRNSGLAANVTFSGPITLNDDVLLNAGANTGYILTSGVLDGPGAVTVSGAADSVNNYVRLAGANSFTGGVTLESGTLQVGHNSALGTGTLTVNGGTLAASDATPRTLANSILVNNNFTLGQSSGATGTLTLSGPVNLGAATRVVTVVSSNAVFSGVVSGVGGGLTKAGSGSLTLSATSTYSGPTTVTTGGALFVDGSLASGPVSVKTGTILGGNGSFGGSVDIAAGATLAPGRNAIGSLRISNTLTLEAGSTTILEISQARGTNDSAQGMTTVSYGGTLTVTNLEGSFVGGESYQLFRATACNGKFTATNLPPLGQGLNWVWNPTSGVLAVSGGITTTSTNISLRTQGDTLRLSWPASHLGWYAQSNSVSVAAANWYDIAGSQNTTNLVIAPNPAMTNVFYRLRRP